jgi:hypothetical protein
MAKSKKNNWIAWSEDEVKLLKKLFPRGRAREIAERTGRPLTAVRQKAYSMGIKTREQRRWSAYEVKLLKKLYPTENTQSIADKLGRPLQSVQKIAWLRGIKKVGKAPVWSRQEDTLLKKLYPDNSVRNIANQLERTVVGVMVRAHKLGINKPPHSWSKKEVNLLKELYPSRTAGNIANQIGRTVSATRRKIVKLGLKKYYRYEECHRVVDGVKQKRCCKCKRWKGESDFCKNRLHKDDLQSYCKVCVTKAANKAYKKRLAIRVTNRE